MGVLEQATLGSCRAAEAQLAQPHGEHVELYDEFELLTEYFAAAHGCKRVIASFAGPSVTLSAEKVTAVPEAQHRQHLTNNGWMGH